MCTENNIFNFLREEGCCKFCSLRYLDNRNIDFNNVDQYLKEKNLQSTADSVDQECDPQPKKYKSNPCIVCLGLLQDFVMEDTVNQILISEIQKYDTSVFTCSISMPAAIILREYAVRAYLKSNFPTFYERDIEEIPLNKVWKTIIKEKLVKKLNLNFENSDVCSFSINVIMDYKDNEQELTILKKVLPERKTRNASLYSKKFISSALADCPSHAVNKDLGTILSVPTNATSCSLVEYKHNSIYLAGRYKKYSRELSQTPWIIDGIKAMELSVEEIIFAQLSCLYNILTKNLRFSASGREDCDVRCLGKGRPFYIEILDPKKTQFSFDEFRKLENAINASPLIKVKDLQMVDRCDLGKIKQGEETKSKEYVALCHTKIPIVKKHIDKINSVGEITLKQKTPIRVLHRRPLAVREKKIYEMKAKAIPENENMFVLYVITQAGTYVKEFVHGDFGRTSPNLCEIIDTEVDIIALDVMAINLDWPEEINTEK